MYLEEICGVDVIKVKVGEEEKTKKDKIIHKDEIINYLLGKLSDKGVAYAIFDYSPNSDLEKRIREIKNKRRVKLRNYVGGYVGGGSDEKVSESEKEWLLEAALAKIINPYPNSKPPLVVIYDMENIERIYQYHELFGPGYITTAVIKKDKRENKGPIAILVPEYSSNSSILNS